MRLVPAALILCLASVTTSQQPQPRRVPVVVELFTSEGCSSCPPADDLLRRLIQEQPVAGVEVIGLSEHVDYWNQLGWQDPFSSSRFTTRQEEYAQQFDGNGMYTPQAVVDGRFQMIGSDGPKLRDAILSAAKAPKATVDVRARSSSPDRLAVSVEVRDVPTEPRGDVDVMVALIENGFVIDVKRGENARRRLHHDAVVRILEDIGRLPRNTSSGTFTTNLKLSPAWARPNLKVVAFLQHRRTSHIVGAGSSRID
jgi:hypothetical protein